MSASNIILTPAAFATLSPAAQAEVLRATAPPPPAVPAPTICYVHPPPPAPGMPPPLGYSMNSRGEYSTYCPGCSCPPDMRAAREAAEARLEAAGDGEESPAPGPLGPAHNTSAWDWMREAAEELEEAIAGAREMAPAAFQEIVERCAYYLEAGNPVVERAYALLQEIDEEREREDSACGCRGRYCSDCWPGGYQDDGRCGR